MGKTPGKNSRAARRGQDADDDFDDHKSSGSGAVEMTDVDEGMAAMLDQLSEKRTTTREAAYKTLVAYLLADVRDEDCISNEATVISKCLLSIRKGGATEATLAAQVLGLHFISLPETSEKLFREVQLPLYRAASAGEEPELRCMAADSLAMTCFVAAEDEQTTLEVMEQLQSLWTKGDSESRAAALRGWSLLFTALHSVLSLGTVEALLAQLAQLLRDKDVVVRNAAGEVSALLYYKCGVAAAEAAEDEDDDDEDGEFDETDGSGEAQPHVASTCNLSEAGSENDGLEGLVMRMKDLATNRGDIGGLRRNKRERASLRSKFRGLLGGLQDGSMQPVKIKLQYGDVVVIDTLEKRVMLDAVKRCLATGFQAHMQRNPLLHSVFGFAPLVARPERMSTLEKRLFRSPSSADAKGRTANRKGERRQKSTIVCGGGGYDDDY